jgi:tetratricopeptide (TPR) repeat protein
MAKKKPSKSRKKPAQSPPNPSRITSGDRRASEKMLQDIHKILNQQEFGSIEEANQFMQQLMASTGGYVPERSPRSSLERAQDVMYRAWESPNRSQRVKLARQALEISPDCADAYVLLAEENARTPAEARALYEQGVKAGERALSQEDFEEMVGYFWGILETRPYMRARLGLAQALWVLGEHQQAADHMHELLRLNPGDNQGVRYLLATLLLQMGDDTALDKLLAQYPDDWSANWKYSAALLAFRKDGKSERANALLKEAIQYNRFVPPFLLGRKNPPKQMPAFVSPGQENEAVDYAVDAVIAWQQTPGARDWLKEILAQSQS